MTSAPDYGHITMEDAKQLTSIFIPQGPVAVSNWNQICENCNQFHSGGKEYGLIDVSQKNHLRHWFSTKICWKCNVCGHVSWQHSEALDLQGQFSP